MKMPIRIFTLPFNEETQTFHDDIVSQFCLNNTGKLPQIAVSTDAAIVAVSVQRSFLLRLKPDEYLHNRCDW